MSSRVWLGGHAGRGATVYGECGGYMVLGEGLEDADGVRHGMAGLLAAETSFAHKRMHLGYRQITLRHPCFLGAPGTVWRGHEFHYASLTREDGPPLFTATDVRGERTAEVGCVRGSVLGSFLHLIDRGPRPA